MLIPREDRLTLAAYVLVIIFAGFNAIGARFTILELPPFWGATMRFAPAALILFGLVFLLKLPLPGGRALLGAVIYGVLNFGAAYIFIYYGLVKVLPGMAQVILALVPIFTLIFTVAHHQETFRWHSLLAAVLALGGIALIFREQLQFNVPVYSLLAMMMGAASFAEAGVVAKAFPRNHPITTNAVGMLVGAAMLFIVSTILGEPRVLPVKTSTWAALLFLILIGSCTVFILALYVLKRWSASSMSYTFVLLPFVTLAASAWLLDEKLSPVLLAGAALVLMGVFIGLYQPAKRVLKEPNEELRRETSE